MRIDIISDVVCPWCYVGKRRLERALKARPALDFDIRWHPYQLNPDVPAEGMDRKAYLKQKFGEEHYPASMLEPLHAAGKEEGIAFDFNGIAKAPNTLSAHAVIRNAHEAGVQDAVVERLFKAYFIEGRDIGDQDTLIEMAEETGMKSAKVREFLTDGRDHDRIRAEITQARNLGVQGVPAFIIAGKYAISGAQSSEAFIQAIDQVQKDNAS